MMNVEDFHSQGNPFPHDTRQLETVSLFSSISAGQKSEMCFPELNKVWRGLCAFLEITPQVLGEFFLSSHILGCCPIHLLWYWQNPDVSLPFTAPISISLGLFIIVWPLWLNEISKPRVIFLFLSLLFEHLHRICNIHFPPPYNPIPIFTDWDTNMSQGEAHQIKNKLNPVEMEKWWTSNSKKWFFSQSFKQKYPNQTSQLNKLSKEEVCSVGIVPTKHFR